MTPNIGNPHIGEHWQTRFWLIWVGQALSLVGSALTQFMLLWWVTKTTNSSNALALAGVFALLPQAIFGPLGGVVADRFSRRTIMIVADSITAACMLVLIWLFASNTIQLWHVYTLMFVRSSMQAFQAPASAASTQMLVPDAWLGRVAGLNQTLQGIMTIAAAPLGAFALAFMPLQQALLIDVTTALLGIAPLLFFAIPQPKRQDRAETNMFEDLRDGLQFILERRGLLMLYGLLGLVVFTVMPTFSLTPLLVTQHFKAGLNEVALMEGLSGVGMILGGVAISFVALRSRIVALLLSFAVSCGTVALTALATPAWFGLAVVWWFISGVTFATGNAPMTTILQRIVPNHMQGRTMALLSTMMGFAGPLGLLIAGPLGAAIGVRGVFVVGGAISAIVCLLGLFSRDLQTIEKDAVNTAAQA